MKYTYKSGVIGGTFDHFHIGHKHFIDTAFNNAETVIIGLSLPGLYAHKIYSNSIESYDVRKQNLEQYLREKKYNNCATIVPIHDIYGITLEKPKLDVIVITESTQKNAHIINEKRHKKGFSPLSTIIAPSLLSNDRQIISSERIRRGEIDREGSSYYNFFLQRKKYTLPKSLQKELRMVVGKVFTDIHQMKQSLKNNDVVITIGDIVSLSLMHASYFPRFAVVDYKTQRNRIDQATIDSFASFPQSHIDNPPGTINPEIATLYKEVLDLNTHKTHILVVDGEEDLLALPLILLSPLGAIVIYGQRNIGMVAVEITEEKKEYAKKLLSRFD